MNYNGADHLPALLESLTHQSIPHRTLIVDNASTDGSARMAHENYPQFDFLPLRRNTGFARAANIIVERSKSPMIVYVNPDTVLEPDFVEQITAPLVENQRLAAVAGTLVFASQPDIIASAGIQIHRNGVAIDRLLGEAVGNQHPTEVFGASGGAVAYRRSAFLGAGGYPEPFFMYLEDVDLAFRLQLQGWHTQWMPDARARHAYSASAVEGSPFKRRLLARNRLWTLARCMPSSLLRSQSPRIATHDALAFGHGLIRDRQAVLGRAEAIARMVPRWCERRAINPDGGQTDRIHDWLEPSISPCELLRLRQLTARLAGAG